MTGNFEALLDAGTGAIAAQAVDGTTIGQAHADAGGHGDCLNCEQPLIGPHCHRCGQAAHVHRSLGALFHDLAHGVFHFEGRTWSTLPMLAWRPGELTRRYVAGERVRFVSPMALFLFSVFLMYAVFSSLGGPVGGVHGDSAKARIELAKEQGKASREVNRLVAQRAAAAARHAGQAEVERIDDDLEGARAALKGLAIANHAAEAADHAGLTDNGNAPELRGPVDTGAPFLDHVIEKYRENPDLLAYKVQSAAYKFSWLLIPLSLPFIWLMFCWRRNVGLYDHAIFAIYSLSFMTLAAVALSVGRALGLSAGITALALTIVPPVHMYKQLKGAYRLGRFGALWRTAFLLITAPIAALLFVALLFSMEMAH